MSLCRVVSRTLRASAALQHSWAPRSRFALTSQPTRMFCTPKVDASKQNAPKAEAEDTSKTEPQKGETLGAKAENADVPKAAAGGSILPESFVHNPSVYNNLQFLGYFGYLQLASGMICHDVLFLRALITSGSFVMTSFHVLQRRVLRIPLFFSALFTAINLTFAVQIFLARRVNLTAEEHDIYSAFFEEDGMADFEFQKLVRAGSIEKAIAPTRIVKAGEPQTHLAFILEGAADIKIDGSTHVTVNQGEFVGENALIAKVHNARADAVAQAGCRYIFWEISALEAGLKGDTHSRRALEVKITKELAMKLHDSSMLLARENHEVHEQMSRELVKKK